MKNRVWLGTLIAVLVGAALGTAPARAETSFSALASAMAVDVTVANDDLPLVPAVEAAGPAAGASLDSTGQGTAFAADPYPGDTVAELPATAAGLTGLPVPSYPLFVATTSDDQPADHTQPGLELHASCSSSGASCRASSLAGNGPVTEQVQASVAQPADDAVVASAHADAHDLDLPGGVSLTGVHTSAAVTLADGRLTRRSELTVSRIDIGGAQVFSIANGTVVIAGTGVPVPFATLASALRTAGVEAELFAASSSAHGVVAPVLRLRTVVPAGPAGLTRPTAVVYALGGADASVTPGAFRTAPAGSAHHVDPVLRTAPSNGVGVAPLRAGVPRSDDVAPAVAAAPVTAAPASAQLARPAGARVPVAPFDVTVIYLALALCGAVWFGATSAIRILGTRFPWTS